MPSKILRMAKVRAHSEWGDVIYRNPFIVLDGALELASSAAMLGAALCELLVLAGVTGM